jgi:hypothetical protein
MTLAYAFEFKGLAVLLALELTEPADEADIEAITTILDRRPGGRTPPGPRSEEADTGQHPTWVSPNEWWPHHGAVGPP